MDLKSQLDSARGGTPTTLITLASFFGPLLFSYRMVRGFQHSSTLVRWSVLYMFPLFVAGQSVDKFGTVSILAFGRPKEAVSLRYLISHQKKLQSKELI